MIVDIKNAHKILPGVVRSVTLTAWCDVVGGPVREEIRLQLPLAGEIVLTYYCRTGATEDYGAALKLLGEAVKSIFVDKVVSLVTLDTSIGDIIVSVDSVRVNRGDL